MGGSGWAKQEVNLIVTARREKKKVKKAATAAPMNNETWLGVKKG